MDGAAGVAAGPLSETTLSEELTSTYVMKSTPEDRAAWPPPQRPVSSSRHLSADLARAEGPTARRSTGPSAGGVQSLCGEYGSLESLVKKPAADDCDLRDDHQAHRERNLGSTVAQLALEAGSEVV